MEVCVLIRLDRDEVGARTNLVVRAFSTQAAAKDAMAEDFAKVKAERYPKDEDIFADVFDETYAYVCGTDDTDVNWDIKSATVE